MLIYNLINSHTVSAPRRKSQCCSSEVPVYKPVYSLTFWQVMYQNVEHLYAVSSDEVDGIINTALRIWLSQFTVMC